MIARRGTLRIWHWAHVAANPDCEAGKESEWHLAWKSLALDGTQEIKTGNRRSDVLAPGGYAVELQKSAMNAAEVHGREADWGSQGGMVWIFCAIREMTEQRIRWHRNPWTDQRALQVTWSHAPDRVRAACLPSFIDLGDDRLLFVGGWRAGSAPLSGYAWPVSKRWVIANVLRGDKIPRPLGEDPEAARARRAAEREALRRAEKMRRSAERAAERGRAEAERRRITELKRQRQEDNENLEWLEGIRRYCAASEVTGHFVKSWFRWRSWLRQKPGGEPSNQEKPQRSH
jgi:hypothetical protein